MRRKVTLLFVAFSLVASGQTSWRDSLDVLNTLIATQPYSKDLHLRKAAVNIELEQWDYAVDEYTLVLKHDHRDPAALFFRAYAETQLREYKQAKADYETFLSIVPIHFEAKLALAITNERMGRKTDALDQMNSLVELFPDSASAWAARAALERESGMNDAEEYDWNEAVKRNPANADYRFSLADALIRGGKKREARRQITWLLEHGVPRADIEPWIKNCQ